MTLHSPPSHIRPLTGDALAVERAAVAVALAPVRDGPSIYSVMSLLDRIDVLACECCEDLRFALLAWVREHSDAAVLHPFGKPRGRRAYLDAAVWSGRHKGNGRQRKGAR